MNSDRNGAQSKTSTLLGSLAAGIVLGIVVLSAGLFLLGKRKLKRLIPLEGHWGSYFSLKTIKQLGIGLLVAVILVGAVSLLLFGVFETIDPAEGQLPPEARLPEGLALAMQALETSEAERLNSYGWVDPDAGLARIPIQRAMEIVAERGVSVAEAGSHEAGLAATPPANLRGDQVFQELGCQRCHQAADTQLAPTLAGLFGETVTLIGGETIVADEDYLRKSILSPEAEVVAGYQPIMPTYAGRITEAQLNALIGFIRSLEKGE